MGTQSLKLHFGQLLKAWEVSKHNQYSDPKKKHYQNTLKSLIKKLSKEDFNSFKDTEIEERKLVINFIFKSLGILDSSTTNQFPFEIIYCLQHSLHQWIDEDIDNYVIVTSLTNSYEDFYSFDGRLALDEYFYEVIENVYGIKFNNRLVQINLPKFLARDYFNNIVLYHELGHFIDYKYRISETLALRIRNNIVTSKYAKDELTTLQEFFLLDLRDSKTLTYHLSEYFSDLFAAQYIGTFSENFLNYITGKMFINHTSQTHPSTFNRGRLVNDFISKQENTLINEIKDVVYRISNKELKIRYNLDINSNELIKLIPLEINDSDELSSVFVAAWDLFSNYKKEIENQNNFGFELKPSKLYGLINNLVEKSIGNHIIKTSWKKAQYASDKN